MPVRLASPLAELQDEYEVVVVGSGYGGGIAASRLARLGLKVCVLERGREIQPGEYPDTAAEAAREFQVHSPDGAVGNPAGLYDLHLNGEICVFVGCGLGGTSLVNANVSLEADPRVFADPKWPKELRDDVGGRLARGYAEAKRMLKPVPLPADRPVTKLTALERSARALGTDAVRLPINVTFEEPPGGVNHVGVEQHRCELCGDCVTGCNHGAKNTVLMNYLPDAANHGASIFTSVSVRRVSRDQDRWVVHYRPVGLGREAFAAADEFVRARTVVLAAGTLGSTEILLRSREAGLALSGQLGRRFTGNGDVLAFSYNGDQPIHCIGFGHRDPANQSDKVGPCITGAIDLRRAPVLEDGMIIEDGSLPGALATVLPVAFSAASAVAGSDTAAGLSEHVRRMAREAESLVAGAYAGALQNTQTYLVMSHDDGTGTMKLENDRLRLRWPGVAEQKIFARVNRAVEGATRPLGGVYVEDPISEKIAGDELITVHPLGGCVMGDDAEGGVVNHAGQVFAGPSGSAVHEGLYVSDGSIIPRPLGVNPLLTISALAERTWMLFAEQEQRTIDYSLPSAPRKAPRPRRVGIRFTERMTGSCSGHVEMEYREAAAQADRTRFEFTLTIAAEDLDEFLGSPEQAAAVFGTVTAPGLSPTPLQATEGTFNLLPPDPTQVETRRMRYRMKLTAEDGATWWFDGHKVVHDDPGIDVWSDTTTLFFTVQEGDSAGKIVRKGILRIELADFSRQLTTLEVTNADSVVERLAATWRFGKEFAGDLFDVYGGVAKPLSSIRPDESKPRKKRPLRAPLPEVHPFQARDGTPLRLIRYRGGEKGPVLLSHGLGVSGSIFTLDTVETNLVEFLCAHGYDVWNLEHRASIALPAVQKLSTLDDVALRDYPAAVEKVRAATGKETVQVVAHCYGATALLMSLVAGLESVRSAVVSQVAAYVETPLASRIQSGLHLPEALAAVGIRSVSADAGPDSTWKDRLADEVLRFKPMGAEACQSSTCHRISFLYGPLYDHENLDQATHRTLHETFGLANIGAFEHLALLTRTGHLVDAKGGEVYMGRPERLKLPIAFLHGAKNQRFLPIGTQKTYDWLALQNGDLYSQHVIPGYGHADCIIGKNAVRDVYPFILRHLEDTQSDAEVAKRVAAARPAPEPRPQAGLAGGGESIARFSTLFKVAALSNAAFALPLLFAYQWLGERLGMPSPGEQQFLSWVCAGMALVWGAAFWDIGTGVVEKRTLLPFTWLEKLVMTAAAAFAVAGRHAPPLLLVVVGLADTIWIPIFLFVQYRVHEIARPLPNATVFVPTPAST